MGGRPRHSNCTYCRQEFVGGSVDRGSWAGGHGTPIAHIRPHILTTKHQSKHHTTHNTQHTLKQNTKQSTQQAHTRVNTGFVGGRPRHSNGTHNKHIRTTRHQTQHHTTPHNTHPNKTPNKTHTCLNTGVRGREAAALVLLCGCARVQHILP